MIVGKVSSAEKASIIKNYMESHKDLVRVVVIGDRIPEIMPDSLLAQREETFHAKPADNELLKHEYFNCGEIVWATPRAVTYYIVMYKLISLLSKGTLLVLNNIIKPDSTPTLVDNTTLTYGTIIKLARIVCPKLIFQDSFTNNGGMNDTRLLFRLSKPGIYSTVTSEIKPFNVVFMNANLPIDDINTLIQDKTFNEEDVNFYKQTVSQYYPGLPAVRKALESYKNILVKLGLNAKKDFMYDMNDRPILYRDPNIKVTNMIINNYKYMNDICKEMIEKYAKEVSLEEELNSIIY